MQNTKKFTIYRIFTLLPSFVCFICFIYVCESTSKGGGKDSYTFCHIDHHLSAEKYSFLIFKIFCTQISTNSKHNYSRSSGISTKLKLQTQLNTKSFHTTISPSIRSLPEASQSVNSLRNLGPGSQTAPAGAKKSLSKKI